MGGSLPGEQLPCPGAAPTGWSRGTGPSSWGSRGEGMGQPGAKVV